MARRNGIQHVRLRCNKDHRREWDGLLDPRTGATPAANPKDPEVCVKCNTQEAEHSPDIVSSASQSGN